MTNWKFYNAEYATSKKMKYDEVLLENKSQSQKYNKRLKVLSFLTVLFAIIFLLNIYFSGQNGILMMLLNTLMYAGIVNSLLFITTLYERKNIGYGKENLSLSWNIVFIVSGVVNIAFLVFFYLSKNTWKLPAANNIEFELFRIVFFILALPALTWLLFKKSYIGFSFGGIAITQEDIIGNGNLIYLELWSSSPTSLNPGTYIFSNNYAAQTFSTGGVALNFNIETELGTLFDICTGGNVIISQSGTDYIFDITLTLANGKTVNAYYKGSMIMYDQTGLKSNKKRFEK